MVSKGIVVQFSEGARDFPRLHIAQTISRSPSNLVPSGYQAQFPRGQSNVEFYVNKGDHSPPQGIEFKNWANLHIPYTLMGSGTVFVCFTFQWLNQVSVIS